MTLRLLSYNIRVGGKGREKEIASVIRSVEPDVVVLQEAIRPDVVEAVANACRMPQWHCTRGYSLAFMSRVTVEQFAWHRARFAKRHYLELKLEGSNTRIFGVHLAAIHSNITERRRAYELRAILDGIAKHQSGFHVVTGDFNTLAPGEAFDINRLPPRLRAIIWLTGRTLHWTAIRVILNAGYADGYRLVNRQDAGYTFPTWDGHVRLDYAFVPQDFSDRVKQCTVIKDHPAVGQASDHFPLLSVIEV